MRPNETLSTVSFVHFKAGRNCHGVRRNLKALVIRVRFVALSTLVLFFGIQSPVLSASFFENFDGFLSPGLSFSADPGFNLELSNGRGVFTKDTGTGNGFGSLTTDFQIVGDFSMSVEMIRDNLNGVGEAGFLVSFSPSGFADVWSHGIDDIVGNIFVPTNPGYGTTVINTSLSEFTWGIERVGNTLTLTFDQGGGVQNVRSATGANLGGPVLAQLFLGQETGNTSGHVASFDNFRIEADEFAPVPIPAALPLFISALAGLGFMSRRRIRIQ